MEIIIVNGELVSLEEFAYKHNLSLFLMREAEYSWEAYLRDKVDPGMHDNDDPVHLTNEYFRNAYGKGISKDAAILQHLEHISGCHPLYPWWRLGRIPILTWKKDDQKD